jgi:RNA polymerase sporulation-specific sigma factor
MTFSSTIGLMTEDDSELVLMARKGENEALHTLLTRYEPFIRACSEFDGNIGVEADDLMQEGRLGLVSAMQCFRQDGGASFRTYACLCIKRHIYSAKRHARRDKNFPMNSYVSFDDDVAKNEIANFASANPEDIVISMERVAAVKDALAGMFNPFEHRLFSLYLSGFSYNDMAKNLHVSKKQVDNSLQHIKRKLSMLFI